MVLLKINLFSIINSYITYSSQHIHFDTVCYHSNYACIRVVFFCQYIIIFCYKINWTFKINIKVLVIIISKIYTIGLDYIKKFSYFYSNFYCIYPKVLKNHPSARMVRTLMMAQRYIMNHRDIYNKNVKHHILQTRESCNKISKYPWKCLF
jgi:hypothetical protein